MSLFTFGINICSERSVHKWTTLCFIPSWIYQNFKRCLHVVSKALQRKEHAVSFARGMFQWRLLPTRSRSWIIFSKYAGRTRPSSTARHLTGRRGENPSNLSQVLLWQVDALILQTTWKKRYWVISVGAERTHCDISSVPVCQQRGTWSMKRCLTAVGGETYAADKLELKQLGVQLEVITKCFCQERHIPVVTSLGSN